MQTNDLNILSTANWSEEDFANPESLLSRIRLSSVQTLGRIVTEEDILSLRAGQMINESETFDWADVKIPPSKEMLAEVKRTVSYYETLGKSRRWIRRYIKRKFNITEY
ncbi:Uncharacterised protein [Chryseobacterium nakagawai]|uniref:Uncharacterized protein n=1 Tax=Chryseobacterium nakagawai TaxID=1241982 RepID=A0AAD0YMB6_CHRNA|nr:hypothetical protein [Chryseobacterium nakagawai]AZA91164.1 hypothetical protein EG343_11240 [Chryseobacterium nakagawai]VEH22726.1 Uncharacterised protein [Chryseobacterium nakagawai]